jgi:hypothetical protein
MFKDRWHTRRFHFALVAVALLVSSGQTCLVFAQSKGNPFTDLQSQITVLQGQVATLQTQVQKLQTAATGATFSFAGTGQTFTASAINPNSTFLFNSGVPGTHTQQTDSFPLLVPGPSGPPPTVGTVSLNLETDPGRTNPNPKINQVPRA